MTNAQRIFALSEYGIIDKEVVIAITGMTNKQYEKAKQVKQANFYNGLFSDETKFKKSWVKHNRKSKYGYSLREEFVADFIKANKSKYSIKDICSMVILGNIKVPIIVMENNLYKYLIEKQRKEDVAFSIFERVSSLSFFSLSRFSLFSISSFDKSEFANLCFSSINLS